jgi:hypothetical protein
MDPPKTSSHQSNLCNKNKVEGILRPGLKVCRKGTAIKRGQHWHKNRHLGQSNRTESSDISSCIYGQLILGKGAKNIQWEKDTLFDKQF